MWQRLLNLKFGLHDSAALYDICKKYSFSSLFIV